VQLSPATRLVALLATLMVALTACGDDEAPEGPLAKKSESASASPSEAAATAPPVPRATDNEAGRRAFATWFVKALAYGAGTNDPEPINAVAANDAKVSCSTCRAYTKFLKSRASKGITMKPATFKIRRLFGTGQVGNGVYAYSAIVSYPAAADVKEDGTVVKKYKPSNNFLIEVGLRFRDGAYEVAGWKQTGGTQQ